MLDSAAIETAQPAEAQPAPEEPPKRGGRPRGSLNKATRDVRIAAQKYTQRALTVITRLAEQSNDPRVQLQAAVELLDRAHGKPAQTQLVGGAGGDPVRLQQMQDLMEDPKETARRVKLLLCLGDPNYRAAADAERDARNRGGRQDNFAESFNGTQAPAGESDGSKGTDTPDGETASQQTPERAEESTEPEPPSEGKSVWFGLLEVRNVGPCREGLPSMFALHRGGQEVMRSSWVACLAKAEKLLDGVPLPKGKLADTRTETVPLHVRADQSPPLPQHSYATRRRAR